MKNGQGASIPTFSYQSIEFDAEISIYNIPFTAVENDCVGTSSQDITGRAKLSGVTSFLMGDFTTKFGPKFRLNVIHLLIIQ